jgi:hypothetical protein
MPRVESTNPCLLVFVVDQSLSMKEPIGGSKAPKKDALASAVNQYLYKLARFKCRSSAPDGSAVIRPRFHIALIGYSGERVYSAFEGPLAGRSTVPIDELSANPIEIVPQVIVEDGIEETSKVPVWLRPKSDGNTPMYSALEQAATIVKRWLVDWPHVTVPPIVLNITDGQFTSGPDPTGIAQQLSCIQVGERHVLAFNLHLSEHDGESVFCPETLSSDKDEWARLLFDISSELTPEMRAVAREKGYDLAERARGFAFNADIAKVFDFLDIGTVPLEQEGVFQLPAGRG